MVKDCVAGFVPWIVLNLREFGFTTMAASGGGPGREPAPGLTVIVAFFTKESCTRTAFGSAFNTGCVDTAGLLARSRKANILVAIRNEIHEASSKIGTIRLRNWCLRGKYTASSLGIVTCSCTGGWDGSGGATN